MPSPSPAAATPWPRWTNTASKMASLTSPPAAARSWNSWKARPCRQWRSLQPAPKAERSTRNPLHRVQDMFDREAELREQRVGRRGGAETGHADHLAVQTDVLAPVVGTRRLDRHARAAP